MLEAFDFDRPRSRALLQFREAAKRFVLIRESTRPLLIPYGSEGEQLWGKLTSNQEQFIPQRVLQPYLVSVPQRAMQELVSRGFVTEHESGVFLLQNRIVYGEHKGLDPNSSALDESFWYV